MEVLEEEGEGNGGDFGNDENGGIGAAETNGHKPDEVV
jgi:hypothetical protein